MYEVLVNVSPGGGGGTYSGKIYTQTVELYNI